MDCDMFLIYDEIGYVAIGYKWTGLIKTSMVLRVEFLSDKKGVCVSYSPWVEFKQIYIIVRRLLFFKTHAYIMSLGRDS